MACASLQIPAPPKSVRHVSLAGVVCFKWDGRDGEAERVDVPRQAYSVTQTGLLNVAIKSFWIVSLARAGMLTM
jgi:hypothetical protein